MIPKSYVSISPDVFVWPHRTPEWAHRIFHPHKTGRPKGMSKDHLWGWIVKRIHNGSWECIKCHTIIDSEDIKKALTILALAKMKGKTDVLV